MTEGILPIIRYIPNMMTTKRHGPADRDISDNGQYFHLEHHLLHQIIILLETVGNAVDGFTEKRTYGTMPGTSHLHISEPFKWEAGI